MFNKLLKNLFRTMGYSISRHNPLMDASGIPVDMEKDFAGLYVRTRDYTMTSVERMYSAYKSAEYVIQHDIPGDIVECGVWRGGSSMMMMLKMMAMKDTSRRFFLYDTFEGMVQPGEKDRSATGEMASTTWKESQKDDMNEWCYASLAEVQSNIGKCGYPQEKVHYVKGKVEQTIPGNMPQSISLLRLDTDWFDSTYHELKHLFPLLSAGGVIIVDDYGHWEGARQAVDQYFSENKTKIILNRIDNTGRVGVKR